MSFVRGFERDFELLATFPGPEEDRDVLFIQRPLLVHDLGGGGAPAPRHPPRDGQARQ